MITYWALFALAILFSLLSTRRVLYWAKRKGWVDRPDSVRKLHPVPIPRIGGIAIYLSLLLSIGCLCFFPTVVAENFRLQLINAAKLLGLSGMMLLIGLWDDLKNLKPWAKFSAQITVALIAWLLGFRILSSWGSEGTVLSLGILSLPLTVLWIVVVTNALNLIDGMDGLSAGAALFATAAMVVPSLQQGQILSPVILFALAGSIVGFLRFNFNPASIFLGDSGSLLLGSLLSLLAVEYSHKSTAAFAIGVPIVALGLPVLDTLMVIMRRFLNGKPIFQGDRRHIHHVLIERGLKPRNVVILLYGVCGLFGLFSLLFLNPSGRTFGIVLVILGLGICLGIQQLHCFEFRELLGYLARGIRYQRRFLIGNVMVGKMIDGFHEARSIQDMLESLSSFLGEMDFSRAEVRVPCRTDDNAELNLKNWTIVADEPSHSLYRWNSERMGSNLKTAKNWSELGSLDETVLNTHFRLEFVFKIPIQAGPYTLPFEENQGFNVGRLTFYHPTTSRLPVSAVCLLSRQVWKEFEKAINRISAKSKAEVKDRGAGRNTSTAESMPHTPESTQLPLLLIAPLVNRMTNSQNKH
jgi:UDP-GlcNAc:undecaprenyl-phosphate GlcNAc-1-phosphate transferase